MGYRGMTREEAIAVLEESKRQNEIMRDNPSTFWASYQMDDGVKNSEKRIAALDLALAALRGPTREMVERMFPGCKMCKPVCHKCKNYPLALYPLACKTCIEHSNFEAVSNFCEDCGRPMTDEAVDMMLERWKEAVSND